MNKLLIVALAVLVGALLLLPLGLIPGFGPTVELPPVVETPSDAPEGAVYWAEVQYDFTHFPPIDSNHGGDGKSHFSLTGASGKIDLASSYRTHTLTAWEENLDDGYSFNLQGTCQLLGEVRVYHVRDDGQNYKGLIVWPGLNQVKIEFPCNQGGSGKLILRPPTFFINEQLPGEPMTAYHFDFVGTTSFIAGDYKEVDSHNGGAKLCPPDRPADYC